MVNRMVKDKPYRQEYKSPKRKLKNKCEVCKTRCTGKRCKKCYDPKLVWTVEKRRKHGELVRERMKHYWKNENRKNTKEKRFEKEIKDKLGYLVE